jgi:2Fe-2S ferredoxin
MPPASIEPCAILYRLPGIDIMPTLTVVTRQGEEKQLEGHKGQSLMEIIRDSGTTDMQALCGGCCSCATCHVYVDPAFADRLTPITDTESDLLDGTVHRQSTSRLSCQVQMSDELAGIKVTMAPED